MGREYIPRPAPSVASCASSTATLRAHQAQPPGPSNVLANLNRGINNSSISSGGGSNSKQDKVRGKRDARASNETGIDHEVDSSAPKCSVDKCDLEAPLRRIVSHYFGRNKKETRAIPDSVWIFYCRQHYQRNKYRQRTHKYAETQMQLVRQTVENLEIWGGVIDFSINLRKRAALEVGGKSKSGATSASSSPPTTSSVANSNWLVEFTGSHKSFGEVYDVIQRVETRSLMNQCPAAEFELVPNIRPEFMKLAARSAARRAE